MSSRSNDRRELRRAVAAAVRRDDGLILAVRRPDEPGEELPGVWGLPAVTLREGESPEDGMRRIGREKLGVDLKPLRLLAEGEQSREGYTLHMTVYETSAAGEPRLPARSGNGEQTLYEAFDWLPDESFREAAERGSLCCALLLEARSRRRPPRRHSVHVSRELRRKMSEITRDFRKEATPSEERLWRAIRNRKLDGRKFRRQHPIGPFVVDFYCAEEQLVVEVDGPIHRHLVRTDRERQRLLEEAGLHIVRVPSHAVDADLDGVLNRIRGAFGPSPRPAVTPLPARQRGSG